METQSGYRGRSMAVSQARGRGHRQSGQRGESVLGAVASGSQARGRGHRQSGQPDRAESTLQLRVRIAI